MTPLRVPESIRERDLRLDHAAAAGICAETLARAARGGSRARRVLGNALVAAGSRINPAAPQPHTR